MRIVLLLAGCLAGAMPLLGIAEVFLRLHPPEPTDEYFAGSPAADGPYAPDADFHVGYRSWDSFVARNRAAIERHLPFASGARPTWAFFGNSFIQAPGMLADHARRRLHDRTIFSLGRNVTFVLRFGQVKLLLENGFRPERILFEMMPVDLLGLGVQPLGTIRVTEDGTFDHPPRLPSGAGARIVEGSMLARAAWFRTGRHRGNPAFRKNDLYERIDEPLLGDVRFLLAGLARVARRDGVPVTVVLIPSYTQVVESSSYGFQDTLIALCREVGLDAFDPRQAFRRAAAPASLYVPDKHLSDDGNRLLLDELLEHVARSGAPPPRANQARAR